MITYKEISLKDDEDFIKVARNVLRNEFSDVIDDARDAMISTYNSEPNDLHKNNAARKAANLVILSALKEFGVTNWRELIKVRTVDLQRVKSQVNTDPSNPTGVNVKGRYTGKSILEMADERKGKK